MDDNFKPTADTRVRVEVSLKEPTGSTLPIRVSTTLGKLGIEIKAEGKVRDYQADIMAALKNDDFAQVENLTREAAKDKINDTAGVAQQLRAVLVQKFKDGSIDPQHPIDSEKYQWQGNEDGLLVTLQEDEQGPLYFVTGSGVWG